MNDNPLVAAPQSGTTAVTGIGIAESSVDLANGIADRNWVEAGLGGVGVGLEVLSMVIDPVGTVASYGVGWLMEHVQPLKEALDWLAGDPPVIRSFSETWGNVAAEVKAVAEDLGRQDAPGWEGAAAQAYRSANAEVVDAIAGAGVLAEGVGVGVMVMGEVVAAVRELVRDLVAELVGRLIAWALEAVATLGLATPVIVAQAVTAISRMCSRIADLVRKLVKTISNVAPRIRAVVDELGEIMQKLGRLGRRTDTPSSPGTTGASSAPSAPDAPTVRGSDGATSPSSSTAPQGTPSGTTSPSGTTLPAAADAPQAPAPNTPSTTPAPDGASRSPDRPDNPRDTSTPEPQRRCESDPVDVVTGEVVLPQTDVELPGALPLVVRRTHISSYRSGRSFGRFWASTLDQRVQVDDLGAVFVADDGMRLVYPPLRRDGAVLPEHGPHWPLSLTDDGFTITRQDEGVALRFGRDGRLTAIEDRNGHRMAFHYDGTALVLIEHSGGYRIAVDSVNGLVNALRLVHRTADVVLVRYRYDDRGGLTEVVNSSSQAMRFDYDPAGRLAGWQDRNGSWYRYVYDSQGRCTRTVGVDGFLDGVFEYHEDRTVFTDSLGARRTFALNELRQIVAETDALGGTTTNRWDRHGNLLASTDPTGATTRYERDATGSPSRVTRADGSVITVRRDASGLPEEVVEPDGAVWRREHDARGNVTAVTDPLGHTTRYAFDERGHLTTVTDHLGHARHVRTDAAGLTTAVTDASGRTVRYDRDVLGRVTAVTDGLGQVVRYGWTVEGKPAWRTLADGTGERWAYDGEGNCVEHVSASGGTTRVVYNSFDLPVARTGPDGATLRFAYDRNLRLVSVTNPHGATWHYEYDAGGRLVRETDFNGRALRYRHDAAGRLVERVDATGDAVRYTRDVLGRVVEQRSGDRVTRFEYDGAGRITRAVGPDAELVYERDPLGRVLAETCGDNRVTSTYDPLGRRTLRTLPSGTTSTWEFDHASRPVGLEFGGHRLSFGYDALGRESERTVDDRLVLIQAWDSSHRLKSQVLSDRNARTPLQERDYHYAPGGHLVAVGDRLSGPRAFEHDATGRVTAVRASGWTERYAYDAAGNPAEATTPDGASGPREYAGTRLVRAGVDHYRHDGQGRVVLRQHKPPSAKARNWHYTWEGERLVGVVTPEGARWRYRYDPLGRRVRKERLSSSGEHVVERVDFIWDGALLVEQNHVVAESTRSTTTWDWEPGAFRPLAQLHRTSAADAPQEVVDVRFRAIVTDLVGSPAELVDPDAGVVWHNRSTLWGAPAAPPPDGEGTPWRFPGQYFDAESGLHYSFHRYYDPASARFLSADPLGLAPGPDPHAYVADPRRAADPLGLTADECTRRLNIGAGQNPMDGATNVDITANPELGVTRADANDLPFDDASFNEVHAVNPYGYQPVSPEIARVLEPGGTLTVSGSPVNRFIRRAPDNPEEFGLRLEWEGPMIEQHRFGTQTRVDGSTFATDNHITRIYRRI